MHKRRSRSVLFILGLAAVAWLSSAGAAFAASDGSALYAHAVEADDSVSYSGTLTSVVYETDHASSTVARIEHKAPNDWRIWYVAPEDAYGRMIVSNESLTYQYEPSRGRVYSHDFNQTAPGILAPVDLARVEANYSVEMGPPSSVAGRKVTSLSLVSKNTGSVVQRLWVDDQTKLILRRENYAADGNVGSRSSFDSIRIGVKLPQALFDLTVPAGMTLKSGTSYGKSTTNTTQLIKDLDFKFAPPKYLPNGFTLERGSLASHDGVNTVEFVYGDGIRTFSLFENATGRLPRFDRGEPTPIHIGEATGEFAEVEGQSLASWNAAGLNFTIVGDLSTKEIAKIGASIHP
ncbi:MAG TPA: sigma-E factor regulatory protein RseB domain-containing protein [Candidatus Eremiobacteraceae bacterium]|nr:sigma-E factor regulatory protein RseB domain-containing protein [Candidatus Eremiobacteraceae bacterium]